MPSLTATRIAHSLKKQMGVGYRIFKSRDAQAFAAMRPLVDISDSRRRVNKLKQFDDEKYSNDR